MKIKAIISLLLLTAILLSSVAIYVSSVSESSLPSENVRIMSINLAVTKDNISARAPRMIEFIKSFDPDSVGTQENNTVGSWPGIMEEKLEGYRMVGQVGDSQVEAHADESNRIYYKDDKYECVAWETIWLSPVTRLLPDAPDAGHHRSATWAILRNRDTGALYAHINTHLAYENMQENLNQMNIIAGLMERFISAGIPVYATGDFNTSEGSAGYNAVVAHEGISDSKHIAEKTMSKSSFRGWSGSEPGDGNPIDFCFVSDEFITVREYRIVNTVYDGTVLTDHCALVIDSTVGQVPDPFSAVHTNTNLTLDSFKILKESVRTYVYEAEFTQQQNYSRHVYAYYAELHDSKGNTVDSRYIKTYMYGELLEERHTCTFGALDPDSPYTLLIYATDPAGNRSEPVTIEFRTAGEQN